MYRSAAVIVGRCRDSPLLDIRAYQLYQMVSWVDAYWQEACRCSAVRPSSASRYLTVDSEKDHLGQKLRDVEAARESQWARQQDTQLLDQMRKKKWASPLACLRCGKTLQGQILGKTRLFACPEGHGIWVDGATVDSILKS
jgi:hypothetical protein